MNEATKEPLDRDDEHEKGQYPEGDYGETGTVPAVPTEAEEGEYQDADTVGSETDREASDKEHGDRQAD